jgi:hypothetical protein
MGPMASRRAARERRMLQLIEERFRLRVRVAPMEISVVRVVAETGARGSMVLATRREQPPKV